MPRPNDPVLRRCRTIVGSTTLIPERPALTTVADAVYVPFPSAGAWGIYRDGREVGGANAEAVGRTVADYAASKKKFSDAGEDVHLYLGQMNPHFGHFITDVAARLWPLLAWEGRKPRLLCHGAAGPEIGRAQPFIARILERLGLGIDALVAYAEPRRIPNLVLSEPCFVSNGRAHHVYRDLCRHVGRAFWREAEVDTVERPVFLSKLKLGAGALHKLDGEAALVAELEARGVDIVFPEALSFPEQIDLLARRRVVMGLVGSAFHTSLYSAPNRRIIGLHWWRYVGANFTMIDALNGNGAFYYHHRREACARDDTLAMRWTIEDPRKVAAELVERAHDVATIEARDAAEDDTRARWERSLPGRTARLYGAIDRRLNQVVARLRRGA